MLFRGLKTVSWSSFYEFRLNLAFYVTRLLFCFWAFHCILGIPRIHFLYLSTFSLIYFVSLLPIFIVSSFFFINSLFVYFKMFSFKTLNFILLSIKSACSGTSTFRLYVGSAVTGAPSKCCGIKTGIPLLPQRAGSKSLYRVVISFLQTQNTTAKPNLSCTETLTALFHTSHKGRLAVS
jgi:hypothetical protein